MEESKIDSVKALLIILLLTMVNMYIPILSLIVLFIWPVPVAYLAVKHGMRNTAIVIAIAAIINGFFFGPMVGLITVIGFGFVGFVIGGSLNEGFSPLKTLIFTVFTVLISNILIILISKYILGFNFNNLINEVMTFLSETKEISQYRQIIRAQLQFVKNIFPSLMVISAMITGIINYYVVLWYLNTKELNRDTHRPVKYWYFSRWFISLGIAISLLLQSNLFFLNLNVVLIFVAFIQGFAVGLYYIDKKGNALFRWIFIFLILFFPPVPILLAVVGLLDMWFNFRKISNQPG